MFSGSVLSAGIIIVGNEILSGEVGDMHLKFLASNLNSLGIKVTHACVLADNVGIVSETVKDMKEKCDYVFVTGGIGPTHDDITTVAVAQAFDADLEENVVFKKILEKYCRQRGEKMNEARLKMTRLPKEAVIIPNNSAAPGFILKNVYVLAGMPAVLQAMFYEIKDDLCGGDAIVSDSLSFNVLESSIAHILSNIQDKYKDEVNLGSYPFVRLGVMGTDVVIRATSKEVIQKVKENVIKEVNKVIKKKPIKK